MHTESMLSVIPLVSLVIVGVCTIVIRRLFKRNDPIMTLDIGSKELQEYATSEI